MVGQVWARAGAAYLLLDQVRARLDHPSTVKAVVELSGKRPMCIAKLSEDKANGSAVIQMLSGSIPGLLPVNPEGGKVARAAAASPLIEVGNVYLTHPQYAPWVNEFIEECAAFPNGAHDDQVDAMTQALIRWNQVPSQQVVTLRAGSNQLDLICAETLETIAAVLNAGRELARRRAIAQALFAG